MSAFDYCISVVAGIIFITLGILRIKKLNGFKTEIRAEFVKIVPRWYFRGDSRCSPVFKYEFNSNEFEKESFQHFDKKELPAFVKGEIYSIYINEKNPEQFVIDRKISFWEVLLVVVLLLIGFSSLAISSAKSK